MSDRFTEVQHVGIFSRLGSALGGMLLGLVMFIVAFPLLIWNEGRAVKDFRSIAEGEGAVVSISADRLDPAHDGQLVHFSATARAGSALSDPELPVSFDDALRLQRRVEMFQWTEHEEVRTTTKVGGTETRETTYTYARDWQEGRVDSARFRHPEGHENPPARFDALTRTARDVTAGAFRLPERLVGELDGFQEIDGPIEAAELPPGVEVRGAGFYYSHAAATGVQGSSAIGDQRISISTVPSQTVSVVGRQAGGTIEPYRTSNGRTLHLIQAGHLSAADMFSVARDEASLMTWSMRGTGLVMMALGLGLLMRPLSVLASVIPPLEGLVGSATGMVAVAVALPLALTTIAVAWFAYRPILAAALIAAGVVVGVGILFLAKRRKAGAEPPADLVGAGAE